MFCANCGKELVDGSKFCSNCGQKVVYEENVANGANEEPVQPTANNSSFDAREEKTEAEAEPKSEPKNTQSSNADADENVFRKYVQAYINHDENGGLETHASKYYLKAFTKIKNDPSYVVGNNASAFIAGGFNFLYRKSYAVGAVLLGIEALLCFSLMGESEEFFLMMAFAASFSHIFAMLAADKIHYNRFMEQLKIAKDRHPNDVVKQCSYLAHC